jgi:uncharacterized protein (TIGR02646 family)
MKHVTRLPLPKTAVNYLKRKETDFLSDPTSRDIDHVWRDACHTQQMRSVREVLRQMGGMRERCMYCADSRGTDIEHFRPKKLFPSLMFTWENLLLACAGCNDQKGSRFPVDVNGAALLIDPTIDEPWTYLVFDVETGLLIARFDANGVQHPKGTATLEVLPLDREAITQGRRHTLRNLVRAVRAFLATVCETTDQEAKRVAESELVVAIKDNNDYGLDQWFFLRDGQEVEPFSTLKKEHPSTWDAILQGVKSIQA